MTVTPQTLPSLDTVQWGSLYEFRWRSTSGDYEIYGLWHLTGGYFEGNGYNIQVDTTTNTWDDSGSDVPTLVTEQLDGTVLLSDVNVPNYYRFTKPTVASWISSGSGSGTQRKVFCNFW